MNIAWATVIESDRLYGDTWALWLHAPEVARGAVPGQFLMLRCHDAAPSDGERNVAATFRSPVPGPHEGHGEPKLASTLSATPRLPTALLCFPGP